MSIKKRRFYDSINQNFKLLPMPDSFHWENNANVVFQKLVNDHSRISQPQQKKQCLSNRFS